MSKKLYLLGIDGLSFDYLKNHLDDLPNFQKMILEGQGKVLESTFPPDSIPAWISIYTGVSPAEHGILDPIDYINKEKVKIPNTDAFKGKTFWDRLSSIGKKVCIINPFLAYPVWDINGVFINGSVFSDDKIVDANDKKILQKFRLPRLGGFTRFPNKNQLNEFAKENAKDTKDLFRYSKEIRNEYDYDFYFITYFTLDRHQHFLWRYETNEYFSYKNRMNSPVMELYKVFDNIIGEIINSLDKNESFVIISDHGHDRRCDKVININEILRKNGYFFVNKGKFFNKNYFLEKLKNVVTTFVYKYSMEDLFYKLVKFFPNRQKIKKGHHLKSSKNIAEVSDIFGTNYFGGIKINRDNISKDLSYEAVCNEIINLFKKYKVKGKCVFKSIQKRDDIVSGKNVKKLPDILFELDNEYGVNWSVFTKEIGPNFTYRKISGGHNKRGCFLSYNLNRSLTARVNNVTDVFSFVNCFFNEDFTNK